MTKLDIYRMINELATAIKILAHLESLIKLGWCGLNYNELCVIGKATGLTIEEILVGKIS